MKSLIYIIPAIALFDFLVFEYYISQGADIMFPGLIIPPLLIAVIYSTSTLYIIRKKQLWETRFFLALILFLPSMLFLMVHILIIIIRLADIITLPDAPLI